MRQMLRRSIVLLIIALTTLGNGFAQSRDSFAGVKTLRRAAFVNVNVVDVEQGRILPNHTVFIEDGIIKTIQPTAATKLTNNTFRIDGKNKYLIPGLADMHVHHTASGAFISGTEPAMYSEQDLWLYLANGITTIRNMAGSKDDLTIKRKLASGEIIGPHYYSSGPAWTTSKRGFSVSTSEQAVAAVAAQKRDGFDFIKMYCCFTPEDKALYAQIIAAAEASNIPAVGHIQFRLPLADALRLRSIEHLEHLPRYFRNERPDAEKHRDIVQALRQSKTVVCPTLVPFELYKLADENALKDFLQKPEMRYFSTPQFDEQMKQVREKKSYLNDPAQAASSKEMYDLALPYVRFLHQQNIPLLAGSDAGGIFPLVPGFSLHRELELLTRGGLSPLEALQTSTINVAKFLGNEAQRGSVAIHKESDLVLLDKNPLTNISHTRTIRGVMIGKHWIDHAAIHKHLSRIRKR